MLRDVTILGPPLNGDSCSFLSSLISLPTPPFLFPVGQGFEVAFQSVTV